MNKRYKCARAFIQYASAIENLYKQGFTKKEVCALYQDRLCRISYIHFVKLFNIHIKDKRKNKTISKEEVKENLSITRDNVTHGNTIEINKIMEKQYNIK